MEKERFIWPWLLRCLDHGLIFGTSSWHNIHRFINAQRSNSQQECIRSRDWNIKGTILSGFWLSNSWFIGFKHTFAYESSVMNRHTQMKILIQGWQGISNFTSNFLPLDGAESRKIESHRLEHIKLPGYVKFQAKIWTASPISILGQNPLPSLNIL